MKRRDFIKTGVSAGALLGVAGLTGCKAEVSGTPRPYILKSGSLRPRMKLSWEPYELELRHTFTVASYSRKTTPGVQVRLEYDGFTAHGEASMPPYLGHTVESVCAFLAKVDLEQFADPFQL